MYVLDARRNGSGAHSRFGDVPLVSRRVFYRVADLIYGEEWDLLTCLAITQRVRRTRLVLHDSPTVSELNVLRKQVLLMGAGL
jgi:hypothetical protein